jgi:hypothetical protein
MVCPWLGVLRISGSACPIHKAAPRVGGSDRQIAGRADPIPLNTATPGAAPRRVRWFDAASPYRAGISHIAPCLRAGEKAPSPDIEHCSFQLVVCFPYLARARIELDHNLQK